MFHQQFNSFLMGGFECSTHKDKRGRRLDLIASTRHDEFAEADYGRLIEIGMKTCRDGLRWHLIEPEPFRYDLPVYDTAEIFGAINYCGSREGSAIYSGVNEKKLRVKSSGWLGYVIADHFAQLVHVDGLFQDMVKTEI